MQFPLKLLSVLSGGQYPLEGIKFNFFLANTTFLFIHRLSSRKCRGCLPFPLIKSKEMKSRLLKQPPPTTNTLTISQGNVPSLYKKGIGEQ